MFVLTQKAKKMRENFRKEVKELLDKRNPNGEGLEMNQIKVREETLVRKRSFRMPSFKSYLSELHDRDEEDDEEEKSHLFDNEAYEKFSGF